MFIRVKQALILKVQFYSYDTYYKASQNKTGISFISAVVRHVLIKIAQYPRRKISLIQFISMEYLYWFQIVIEILYTF